MRPLVPIIVVMLGSGATRPASAADTCTVEYRVDARFEVSDTYLGKGDTIVDAKGSLVIEFPKGDEGEIVGGKVKVLHYAMHERFRIDSMVAVTTAVHHYAPTCNGEEDPGWRRPDDVGFPNLCRYTGNRRAVAVGTLDIEDRTIEWARCKAASTYWAKDRRAYTPSAKSKGRGCLNEMHAVGNAHCDGRLACRWGGLEPGDNPQFEVWTQPLLHGPDGSEGRVTVSEDLRTIETPIELETGRQSYNVPNDAPSRTWFSFEATRDDTSRFTTCR
jgi:hypothetical protein